MQPRLLTQPRVQAQFTSGRTRPAWLSRGRVTLGALALLLNTHSASAQAEAKASAEAPSAPPEVAQSEAKASAEAPPAPPEVAQSGAKASAEAPPAPPAEVLPEAPLRAPTATPARSPAVAVPVSVDTVAVRFSAPEMGGVDHPRFIFTRVLAFEARLEALADGTFHPSDAVAYTETHVQNALERHIAETILEGLDVSPALSAAAIQERVKSARVAMALRAGGAQALDHAAELEGLEPYEVLRIVQRQARASLYLDRMVAPMLEPSDPELRGIHQSGRTPFSKQPYEQVEVALRRWYVARRLREAVLNYYEGSRFRVQISVIGE